uniref:Pleiotropic regulator 1 n=1 Tax=Cyprinus carpio TaxID=7962 RepID=A0A8C1V2I2_CYPCA
MFVLLQDVQKHSVHTLVFRSLKRTHDMFVSDHAKAVALDDQSLLKTQKHMMWVSLLCRQEASRTAASVAEIHRHAGAAERSHPPQHALSLMEGGTKSSGLLPRKAPTMPKPQWHPPWKLYRVISGHLGWVRSIAVEPGNQWFVTGSADRTIKVIYPL